MVAAGFFMKWRSNHMAAPSLVPFVLHARLNVARKLIIDITSNEWKMVVFIRVWSCIPILVRFIRHGLSTLMVHRQGGRYCSPLRHEFDCSPGVVPGSIVIRLPNFLILFFGRDPSYPILEDYLSDLSYFLGVEELFQYVLDVNEDGLPLSCGFSRKRMCDESIRLVSDWSFDEIQFAAWFAMSVFNYHK